MSLAEAIGFEYGWFVDSQILWMDSYIFQALVAANTTKLRIGPCVSNPLTRHPTVIASSISTLNEVSKGRAVLGLGRGDSAVRTMGHKPFPLKTFRDTVELIRKLCLGQEARYMNTTLKLKWASGKVPVYIAAYGPTTLELAGEIADGVILQIGNPEIINWSLSHVKRGAEKAHRNFDEIKVVAATATTLTDDLNVARDEVRWYPGVVSNHVFDLLQRYPKMELPTDLLKDIDNLKGKYDYDEHCEKDAKHAALVSDELVDKFTIIGGAQGCMDKIAELQKVGVDQVCLYLFTPGQERTIKLYGEKIIPYFASA